MESVHICSLCSDNNLVDNEMFILKKKKKMHTNVQINAINILQWVVGDFPVVLEHIVLAPTRTSSYWIT